MEKIMPTVKVRNLKNKEVGEVTLSDAVFGVELNEALIHSAVMNYQANGRSGNSATKTRGNVSGSGRKLWKQKGTGRARIASLRSPLWKGGGNVHGPQPRDWSYQMPKKMRRGALRSALSERLREGNLIVIDEFGFKNPKTKEFLSTLGTLGLSVKGTATKTLIVDSLDNANLVLSARNVQKTKITNSFGLNIYDIVYHEKLVLSKAAVEELNNLLDPKRETGIVEPASVEEPKPEEKPKAKRAAKPKADKAEKDAAPVKAKGKAKAAPVEEEPVTETTPVEETAAEAAPAEESVVTDEAPAEETAPAASEEAAKDE
jgi:large subunit ribosomal protein L4